MDINKKGLVILDPETGEIVPFVDGVGIIRANTTKYQNKREGLEKKKSSDELHKYIDGVFGNFYFSCYSNLLELNIDKQYKFRFIYLCTYMNYENQLEYGNAKGKGRLMLEKDLEEVLGLSERETRNTKNELKKNNLLIVNEDGSLSVNDYYCIKGKIGKSKAKESIRVMEIGIRELYKKAEAREHKKLGLLIEILPYINLQHNVICSNPEVEKMEEIKPLNMTEIMKIVGYKNLSRLKKDLLDLTVNGELVVAITQTKYGKFISINPRVYYKGTRIEDLKWLSGIYKIGSR